MAADPTPLGTALLRKSAISQVTQITLPVGAALLMAWAGVRFFYGDLDSRLTSLDTQVRNTSLRLGAVEALDSARNQRFEAMERRLERIEDKLDRLLVSHP